LSYKTFLQTARVAKRKNERAALVKHRALISQRNQDQREYEKRQVAHEKEIGRLEKAQALLQEKHQAQEDVQEFESYVSLLVSIHKDCSERWHWNQLLEREDPPASLLKIVPFDYSAQAATAKAALDSFRPSFWQKYIFKGQARRLKQNLDRAQLEDDRARDEFEERSRLSVEQHHKATLERHQIVKANAELRSVARGVVEGNPIAMREALRIAAPFDEVESYGNEVSVEHCTSDALNVSCIVRDEDTVPKEERSLTASGKLSSKPMALAKYWALYQDYVCSCAFRISREIFAVVPMSRVIVNVKRSQMNSATGHYEKTTIVAVHFLRHTAELLNYENIDPSDALTKFSHRMNFKKTTGFIAVEPITHDEQWVST
jgi:hypothetical protein